MRKPVKTKGKHVDLVAKVGSAGAVMMVAGLLACNAFAASPSRGSAPVAMPAASRAATEQAAVEVDLYDILRLFDTDGLVAFDFVRKLFIPQLTAGEEALFSITPGGLISIDHVVEVVEEKLPERKVSPETVSNAMNQSSTMKNARMMVSEFLQQNMGRVVSSEKVADIATKNDMKAEDVSRLFYIQSLLAKPGQTWIM